MKFLSFSHIFTLSFLLLRLLLSLMPVPFVHLLVADVQLLGQLFDQVRIPVTVLLVVELKQFDLLMAKSIVMNIGFSRTLS